MSCCGVDFSDDGSIRDNAWRRIRPVIVTTELSAHYEGDGNDGGEQQETANHGERGLPPLRHALDWFATELCTSVRCVFAPARFPWGLLNRHCGGDLLWLTGYATMPREGSEGRMGRMGRMGSKARMGSERIAVRLAFIDGTVTPLRLTGCLIATLTRGSAR